MVNCSQISFCLITLSTGVREIFSTSNYACWLANKTTARDFLILPCVKFSWKKLGIFQIVRVQTYLYTFYIGLVLSKNRYGVFSRAVTCGFTGFKNKGRQIWAVTKILGVFHMMHFGSFCRLTTEHNDWHPWTSPLFYSAWQIDQYIYTAGTYYTRKCTQLCTTRTLGIGVSSGGRWELPTFFTIETDTRLWPFKPSKSGFYFLFETKHVLAGLPLFKKFLPTPMPVDDR